MPHGNKALNLLYREAIDKIAKLPVFETVVAGHDEAAIRIIFDGIAQSLVIRQITLLIEHPSQPTWYDLSRLLKYAGARQIGLTPEEGVAALEAVNEVLLKSPVFSAPVRILRNGQWYEITRQNDKFRVALSVAP